MEHLPPASFAPPSNQPPPPPKRKGLSFWLALLFGGGLALAGLVIMVLFVTLGMRGPSGMAAHDLIEQEVEGSGKDKIAWISVHGVLLRGGGGGLFGAEVDPIARVIKMLETAGQDADVKAVILDVDSPGGGITESDQIHHAVEKLRHDDGKKVVVLMGDVAASGGYYVSAGADTILAHPTTITGSIGVISQMFNMEGLMDKIGLKAEVVKSGAFKDIGSSTRPMTDAERQLFQNLVDDMYGKFLEVVVAGRNGVTLPDKTAFDEAHAKKIADGRIYTADEAVANGLIDGVGYREDAVAEAKKLAGVTDARVVEYTRRPNLFDLLAARSQPQAPMINLDTRSLLSALTPRLLFLWTAP